MNASRRDKTMLPGERAPGRRISARVPKRPSSQQPAKAEPYGGNAAQGEPLEAGVRGSMEARFGHDFSRVRVHAESSAEARAGAIGARAYTAHPHVVFGPGEYRPETAEGRGLIAHELTHIVQQEEGRVEGIQRRPPSMDFDDPLEREANEREGRFARPPRGGPLPYRQALESFIPPPHPKPTAAKLTDTRDRVLAAERPMFEDLRTFVRGLPTALRALVAQTPPSEPWMTPDNANVQSALRTLDLLVADLNAERFNVRFDQPLTGVAVASYDFLNDEMHLRTFSGAEERTILATSLLHEYAHILQDREAERVFSSQTRPHEATREEDLKQEIGARREEVYFSEMLRVMHAPIPTDEIFGSQLTSMVFRGRFETERTGKTQTERDAATKAIRSQIETAYAAQLATNASMKTYAVEITPDNHALLHWDLPNLASPRDLGALPATLASTEALKAHLATVVRALPEFNKLFDRASGPRFGTVTFSIRYQGDHITDFGLTP